MNREPYYGDWRERRVTCACGWAGHVDALTTRLDIYEGVLHLLCPQCEDAVLSIALPTIDEIEAAGVEGDEEAIAYLDQRESALVGDGFEPRDFGPWTKGLATWSVRGKRFDLERVVELGMPSYYLLWLGNPIEAADTAEAIARVEVEYLGTERSMEGRARPPDHDPLRTARERPAPGPATPTPAPDDKVACRYYSGWRTDDFTCACGWSGTGDQLVPQIEPEGEVLHFECPHCGDAVLLTVAEPTLEETEDAAQRGDAEALAYLRRFSPDLTDSGFVLRRSGVWTKDVRRWRVDEADFLLESLIPIRGDRRFVLWTSEVITAATDATAVEAVEARYLGS